MFSQDDEFRVWFATHRQRYLACQPKARPTVRNPDQIVAEAVSRQFLAICSAGEVIRRIGVRMIDMGKRQEPMQQSLDGGAWTARLREAVSEVVHHPGVAHTLTF